MTLVMKVGGASGPLYGTLFMALGKALPDEPDRAAVAKALADALAAVKARGKSAVGQKTLLDVLEPVQQAFADGSRRDSAAGDRAGGGAGHHSAEGDPRPGLVPRRALDRPHGSRAPAPAKSWWVRFSMRWSGGHDQHQCRHRHRLAFARTWRAARPRWCARWSGRRCRWRFAAAIPGAGLAPASKASWRRSRSLVGQGGGDAGRSRRGRDQQRNGDRAVAAGKARPGGDLQCADRRGRRHGGDGIVGRVVLGRSAARPRNCTPGRMRDMSQPTAARSVLMKHRRRAACPALGQAHQARQELRLPHRGGAAGSRPVDRCQEHRQGDGDEGAARHDAAFAGGGRWGGRGGECPGELVARNFDEDHADAAARLNDRAASLAGDCGGPAGAVLERGAANRGDHDRCGSGAGQADAGACRGGTGAGETARGGRA